MVAPFWSHQSISSRIKIVLACFISYIIVPFVPHVEVFPKDFLALIFLILKQIFFGALMGFISRLFLDGIRLGASFLDIQMGFSFARTVDPTFGAQSAIIELYYSLTALLILLSTSGHLLMLKAIINTFTIFPLDKAIVLSNSLAENIIFMVSHIFIICLQIAGPIIAVLLLIDTCMGLMAKMMPQMNIFMFDLPLKLGVGIICVITCLPFFPDIVNILVDKTLEQLLYVAKSL
jgi:flagellar biosynthetic protein FliR